MKKSMFLWWFSLAVSPLVAQETNLKPLHPGDPVPDMVLPDILQYQKTQEKLSAFRGKVVILDLWTTACPGCLKSFPVLETLQQQFKGELVLFPVSFGAQPAYVRTYLEKRKGAGHPIRLPTAVVSTYDHPLLELLGVEGFPQFAWIDREGRLLGVTSAVEVTFSNIRKVLAGERPPFASAVRPPVFSRRRPLLVGGNGGADSAFRYRSLLTPYIPGVSVSGFTKSRDSGYTRIFMSNAPVADLVKTAVYGGWGRDVHNKRLLLEAERPERYLMPSYDSLYYRRLDSFAYCYELLLPPAYTYDEAFEAMRADLSRYLRLTIGWEKRPLRCWVLRHDASKGTPLTRGGEQVYRSGKEEWWFSVQNRPLQLLLDFIDRREYPMLVDETGLSGNVDIDIRLKEGAALKDWQKVLGPYGLTLMEEVREVEVLVIRDKQ